jgi:hypothetical protein
MAEPTEEGSKVSVDFSNKSNLSEDILPKETLYVNNLNEKIKLRGNFKRERKVVHFSEDVF